MKKRSFFTLCIAANLFLFILYIHKNNYRVKLSFKRQKYEIQKNNALKEKERLLQKLCLLQNKQTIKEYAIHELHMQPLTLNHVKNIYYHA